MFAKILKGAPIGNTNAAKDHISAPKDTSQLGLQQEEIQHDFSKRTDKEIKSIRDLSVASKWNMDRVNDYPTLLMNSESLPSAAGQQYRTGKSINDNNLVNSAITDVRKYLDTPERLSSDGYESVPVTGAFSNLKVNSSDADIDAALKDHISRMDKAVGVSLLPEDVELHRGLGKHSPFFNMTEQDIGKSVVSPELMMTSVAKGMAASFAAPDNDGHRVILSIQNKAGQKGLYTTGVSSNIQDEAEVILPAGDSYKVTKIEHLKANGGQPYKIIHVSREAELDTSPEFVGMTTAKKAEEARREALKQQQEILDRKRNMISAFKHTLNERTVYPNDKWGNPGSAETQLQHPITKEWHNYSSDIWKEPVADFAKMHPKGITALWGKGGYTYLDSNGEQIKGGSYEEIKPVKKEEDNLDWKHTMQILKYLGIPMPIILRVLESKYSSNNYASILKP